MGGRILIIDDERDMQVYLQTLLRRAGYETAVATGAAEGLGLVESFEPHLVTLDLLMPRRSGVSAYRALRSAARTRGLPVIILTGLSNNDELLRELEGLPPPDLVVEKPIDRGRFLRRVAELLGEPA